jgi:predicted nucleic acid-binding protein
MNGIRLLCDTNVLIHLLGNKAEVIDFLEGKQVFISVITELELYGKQNISLSETAIIDMLIENCFVIDLLSPIKQIVKKIKQKYKIKLPDAIVAATAIYLDIPLLTFDTDFNKVEELKLILLKV